MMQTERKPPAPGERLRVGRQHRQVHVREMEIDEEARTIRMPVSSEYPVLRWWGMEVLDHKRTSIDLARVKSGAAVLWNHNRDLQIGVTMQPEVKDRRVYVTLRFSEHSALADQIFKEVRDGIITGVSFAYDVRRGKQIKPLEKAPDPSDDEYAFDFWGPVPAADLGSPRWFRIHDWEMLEVSPVSVAADPTVGPGRGARGASDEEMHDVDLEWLDEREDNHEQEREMPDKPREHERDNDKPTPPERESVTVVRDAARREGAEQERERAAQIRALAKQHVLTKLGDEAIEKGWTVEEFRARAMETIAERNAKPTAQVAEEQRAEQQDGGRIPNIGMSEKDVREFSVARFLQAISKQKRSLAPFEFECSDAVASECGREAQGGWVPPDVLNNRFIQRHIARQMLRAGAERAIILTSGSGGNLVPTEHAGDQFIDLLYATTITGNLGVTVLDGLVGDLDIPKRTAGADTAWVAEDTAPSADGSSAFGKVTLQPKTLTGDVPVSRRMLLNAVPAVEDLIRMDILRQVAIAMDDVTLEGGGANQPTGILGTGGIGSVSLGTPNGGALTWNAIVDLETEVAIDNALTGSLAYATTPGVRGVAKKKFIDTGSGLTIWDRQSPDAPLNSYPCAVSTIVPSDLTEGSLSAGNAVLFGNWAEVLVGLWGALDLIADPWTDVGSGRLHVRVFQDMDVKLRHVESMAAIKDCDLSL